MNRRFLAVPLLACVMALAGRAESTPSSFLEQLKIHFAKWDLDGNGELSPGEIERAVANPDVKGDAAAAAAALRRGSRNKKLNEKKLTVDEFTRAVPRPKDAKDLPDFDSLFAAAQKRIQSAKRELFVSGLPQLNTLHQGKLGDCFCLAPLGALVHRDPDAVKKMFTVEEDGSITVTFGENRPIKVRPLTDGELALTSSTENDGLWSCIYEKAIGDHLLRKSKSEERPTSLSLVAKGGSAGTMVEFVTGHKIRRISCKPFTDSKVTESKRAELLDELRESLTANHKANRLICGGIDGVIRKVPGILSNHAYAILDYDAKRDEVVLWNPHGNTFKPKGDPGLENGYPTEKGQFRVPLKELVLFFGGFSFETEELSTKD